MRHRIGLALLCLHISAAFYLLVGLLGCLLVSAAGRSRAGVLLAVVLCLVCLGLAVAVEVIAAGLRRRRFWAWVAGVCLFALYVPSLFLPLGAGPVGLAGRRLAGRVRRGRTRRADRLRRRARAAAAVTRT